jgi:hypothetical protein
MGQLRDKQHLQCSVAAPLVDQVAAAAYEAGWQTILQATAGTFRHLLYLLLLLCMDAAVLMSAATHPGQLLC